MTHKKEDIDAANEWMMSQKDLTYTEAFLAGCEHKQKDQQWINVNECMPKTRASYSELDYLVVTKYRYTIGRTFNGKWLDMENRPIEDVTHYMILTLPPTE